MMSGICDSPHGLGDLSYLGLTKREGLHRIAEHIEQFEKGTHCNQVIQNYYNQYGRGGLMTGIVIDNSPDYFLNSLERFYIEDLNTFKGVNLYGWNRSKGGEGAVRYSNPFVLTNGTENHFGNELYPFLKQYPDLDPTGVLKVLDGSLVQYEGWRLPKP